MHLNFCARYHSSFFQLTAATTAIYFKRFRKPNDYDKCSCNKISLNKFKYVGVGLPFPIAALMIALKANIQMALENFTFGTVKTSNAFEIGFFNNV